MKCTTCGTEYESFATFCNTCEKPLIDGDGVSLEDKHEQSVQDDIVKSTKTAADIHKYFFYFYVFLLLMIGVVIFALGFDDSFMAIIALLFLVLALIHLKISKDLLKRKRWAIGASAVIGFVLLFGFPIGTIIGIILLSCVRKRN